VNLLFWIISAGACFSRLLVLKGVSLADIVAGLTAIVLIIMFLMRDLRIVDCGRFGRIICLFLMWNLIVAFLNIINDSFYWPVEFLKSYSKLFFYSFIAILYISFFRKLDANTVKRTILQILFLNSLIALGLWLVVRLNIYIPSLPRYFFRATQTPIAVGVFSESANLSIFLNLGLGFLFFKGKCISFSRPSNQLKLVAIIGSILLSCSLVGYCMLIINVMLLMASSQIEFSKKCKILCVGLLLLLIAGSQLQSNMAWRIKKTLSKRDTSAKVRLFGGWEEAVNVLKDSSFLYGSAVGNYDLFNYDKTFSFSHYYSQGLEADYRKMPNVLAYILGSTGIIGVGIFSLLLIYLLSKNFALGVVFLAFLFASGGFLEVQFWFFCSLYAAKFKTLSKIKVPPIEKKMI